MFLDWWRPEADPNCLSLHTTYHPPLSQLLAAYDEPATRKTTAPTSGRVIFMDDDEQIRALTNGLLANLGYQCDLAKNGEEVLQLYRAGLKANRLYDAVIMDLTVTGGLGGEQTLKQLRELDPQVRAVLTSGYDNEAMRSHFSLQGFLGFLPKPYRAGELDRMIKTVAA